MVRASKASAYSVILVMILSIPVASQQVDIEEDSEGFEAFVDTDFSNSFQMDINTGSEELSIEESGSSYSIIEDTDKKIETFTTPRGSLKIKKTPNMSVEILTTPYGVLKTGFKQGDNISSFSGPDDLKSRVLDLKKTLKGNKSVKSREASVKKEVVMDRILPDISLDHSLGENESITIINNGDSEMSLKGWTVKNSDPDTFSFDRSLRPGEKIVLYPYEAGDTSKSYVKETGVDIDETEDTLTLENRFGRVVDQENW